MFYDYFAKLCQIKGVSPNKACVEMGISRSASAKWKCENGKPSVETFEKMSDYFNVSVSELMNEGKKEEITGIGDLTKDDIELVKWWRSLSEENRQAIQVLSGHK